MSAWNEWLRDFFWVIVVAVVVGCVVGYIAVNREQATFTGAVVGREMEPAKTELRASPVIGGKGGVVMCQQYVPPKYRLVVMNQSGQMTFDVSEDEYKQLETGSTYTGTYWRWKE